MENRKTIQTYIIMLLLLLVGGCMNMYAENTNHKKVRVGWYESPFCHIDSLGKRSGYAYDYQCRIAATTGWTYEYVVSNWPDLLLMLRDGKIDLLSNVSNIPERTDQMLFSERDMGSEEFYIFSLTSNKDIRVGVPASLNGKRIGANKGSYQVQLAKEWAQEHHVSIEVVEYSVEAKEFMDLLKRGEIDAFASTTAFNECVGSSLIPAFHIGSDHYYFAVNKNRPDLKEDLDNAMQEIRSYNAYYNNLLQQRYFEASDLSHHMSLAEEEWVKKHGKIRIAYRDNYLPFCTKDPLTGHPSGMLPEMLKYMKSGFSNVELEFEAVAYPTINEAIEAVQKGEADVAFPNSLTNHDAESFGLLLTDPLVATGEMAVTRANSTLKLTDNLRAAINHRNPNYISLIQYYHPNWELVQFDSTIEAIEGVAAGKADLLLLSNYRVIVFDEKIKDLGLKAVATGLESGFGFTVKQGNHELFSIMNRLAHMIPASQVTSSLTHNSFISQNTTLLRFVRDNLVFVTAFLVLILAAILYLLRRSRMAFRLAKQHLEEIQTLNHELEERQTQLEEVTAEQESQLEEIQKLNANLDSQMRIIKGVAKAFLAIYHVDLSDNSFIELNALQHVKAYIVEKGNAVEAFGQMMQHLVVPEYRETMQSFTDLSTLNERLEEKGWISCKYLGTTGWKEAIFIAEDRDDKGDCKSLIWAIRDIDEYRKKEIEYEKELKEATNAAEAANAAKTSFLFNMSHDIRTPMNAIIGFTELLRKHQEEPEKRTDYLNKIGKSSQVLLSIINNVLEMARIEKGTIELVEQPVLAEDFNETLQTIFREMMKNKGLIFTSTIDILHDKVYIDQTKLREVYCNILSNAYKYTEKGSVAMTLKELPCDREGYALYQTTISDTGMGMSDEFLPYIFDEFARENNSTDNKIEGTGLGMSIVKRLVERMEGTIEVTSKKGLGTTFVVTLPHKIADETEGKEIKHVEVNPAVFEGKRILLAEDNDLNAEIAMEILGEVGFVLERAEDGVQCVEMLAKAEAGYYDVILMDIQMPNMNGYEATKAIRQMSDLKKAGIAILAMTANAFEEDRLCSVEAGMNGHLAKPMNVDELLRALAECLH